MRTVSRWIVGATAAAIMLTVAAPFAGAQEKKLKDGERELYEPATQAVGAQNWAKAVPALEAWKQKFPDSEFKDDRDFYILQGYLVTQQFPKAITFGNDFMDNNVPGLSKSNPGYVIAAYFVVTTAASQLIQKDATDEQIGIGDKAAHKLLEFSPTYFVAANQPAGETPQSFANRRTQMEATANGYLLLEAVTPGQKAEAKKDCPGADAAFSKALMTFPDNSWISYHLARAYNCEQKPFMAMYEFARTAAVDPTQGKTTDGPKFIASVKKMYVTLHGGEDGLDQLMQQAKATPIPSADFKIETDDERKIKQGEEFAKANPEIAAWTNIKTNLTTQGAPFFESMKGAELPQLLGTIADAKPACNPKELILYVPAPENSAKTTEIALKFETPLKGKPENGSNIKFVAVADAFAPAPFLLTMTADKEKVQDLKLSPCTVARPAAGKKKE